MSYFYDVTLNQGRTDTVRIESNSVTDVKNFFQAVSTANITLIKKIVYSKDLNIGSATTTYIPNNQNKFLKLLVKNEDSFITTLNLSFPIKNISKDVITKSVKKNLLCNNKPITEIINILISE